MLAELSIVPLGVGEHLSGPLAQVLDIVDRSGVRVVGIANTSTIRAAGRSLKHTAIVAATSVDDAMAMMQAGADAIYCSGSSKTVEYLAREFIPVVGHVGLVPSRATWTGGFRAVGKTAEQALALYHECRAYQEAGAFAVEIEVDGGIDSGNPPGN